MSKVDNAAVTKFIAMIATFFPRPKFSGNEDSETLWVGMMLKMLAPYDASVLTEAAERIIRDRDPDKDGTMFPKPSECIAACEAVLKLRKGATLQLEGPKGNEWTDDRLSLAFDLANGPLGRRAAREGWIGPLLRFCRQHMRLPKDHEIAQVIAVAKGFEEDREKNHRGENGEMSGVLAKLADSIAARSKEHAAVVLEEAAE
jgi:hypothetical protein